MFSGKNSRLFETCEDVEMREQSSSRDQAQDRSAKKNTKRNLLDQFHEPEMIKKPLNNFIEFSDSEQESPVFKAKKTPFGNRILNQSDDSEIDSILEIKKTKKKMKLDPPPRYASRQFSFADESQLIKNDSERNSVAGLNPNDKVSCKKNLFGNMDENVNPNLDTYMYQSPEKMNNMPLDQFLESELNNQEMQETRNYAPNFKQKWNKGDIVFKGKFSSGVTPKIDRPVIKGIKIKTKDNKRKREEINEEDDSDSNERRNPFLEITPQMKRKVRKCSFENNGDMVLDFSSPTRERKLVCETPMPVKKFARIPRFVEENNCENKEETYKFYEKFNDRGSRFNEDFIEICNIGKGHFGSVVKCQNKLDGIEYAIKITERQHPKKRLNMFEALQEAYALSALSVSCENPYIVRYYRGWIEDEQLYIQMELCDCSLYDQFIDHKLSEKEILKVLRDVSLGLKELHERGIVHLDLKLENILVGSSGKYKLGDLGLSRLINKLKTDVPEGDARYLAMELLNNDPNATLPDLRKCDVFSLGILGYELMEGKRVPQNGDQWHDLREDRISFTYSEEFSDRTKEMILSMLSSDPSKRPTINDLLTTDLKSDQEREIEIYKKLCGKLLLKCLLLNKQNSELLNNQ